MQRNKLLHRRRALVAFAAAAGWPLVVRAAAAPAALPEGLTAPPKPTRMPAFELPTTRGDTLRSESLAGQALLIRFWASW